MKEFATRLGCYLKPLYEDPQSGPVHICVYLALGVYSGGRSGWFFVNRGEIMRLAKVRGVRTYYRVMKDLEGLGVIEYWASRNGKVGSRVRMVGVGD